MFKETKRFLAIGELDVQQTIRIDLEWKNYVDKVRRALEARKIKIG